MIRIYRCKIQNVSLYIFHNYQTQRICGHQISCYPQYFQFDDKQLLFKQIQQDFSIQFTKYIQQQIKKLELSVNSFDQLLYVVNSLASIKLLLENKQTQFRPIEQTRTLRIERETCQLHYFIDKQQLEFALAYADPVARLIYTQVSDFALIEETMRCQVVITFRNQLIQFESILQPEQQQQLILDQQYLSDAKLLININENRNQTQFQNRTDKFINQNFVIPDSIFEKDIGEVVQIVDITAKNNESDDKIDEQKQSNLSENLWD